MKYLLKSLSVLAALCVLMTALGACAPKTDVTSKSSEPAQDQKADKTEAEKTEADKTEAGKAEAEKTEAQKSKASDKNDKTDKTEKTEAGKADAEQSKNGKDASEKLDVVASTFVMYDFSRKIGGDKINVTQLMPPGAEPHGWEPTAQDMITLEKADLLVINGAGMEPWVQTLLGSISNKNLQVVDTTAGLEILKGHHHHHDGEEGEEHEHDHDAEEGHDHEHDHDAEEGHDHEHDHDAEEGHDHEHDHDAEAGHDHEHDHDAEEGHDHEHEHDHGGLDPHTWLSPVMAKAQAEAIYKALSEKDPANAEVYKSNFEALAKRLDELDKAYSEGLKDLTHRTIVTNHEAFAYLCKQYGLKQIGITGVYADHEPSPARMAEIIDLVKKEDIPCIFTEDLLSPKVAEAISEASGAKTAVLNPIGNLSEEQIEAGDDYFSVMERNLETLKTQLK